MYSIGLRRLLIWGFALALVAAGCGDAAEDTPGTLPAGTELDVTYEVVGSAATARVLYTDEAGRPVEEAAASLPFVVELTLELGAPYDVGGQAGAGEEVTCRVLVNGILLRDQTASDGNAAVCQGTLTTPGAE